MDSVAAPRTRATLATVTATPTAPATVEAPASAATTSGRDDPQISAILISFLAVTLPLATSTALWSTPSGAGDWLRSVTAAPFDLVLLLILGWVILHPRLLLDLFRSPAVHVTTTVFVLIFGFAMVSNPSWLGLALGVRLVAGLAVIAVVSDAFTTPRARHLMFSSIVVVGVAQAVLALVQSARGAAFGIELLDYAGPLYPFGSSRAGRGGLTHPYHLAVFLVMAQGAALLGLRHRSRLRWPWLAGLAVIGAGIGVTYSRAGLLGQALVLACIVAGRRDRRVLLLAAGAIVVGLTIGAVGFGDGWVARAATTTGQTETGTVDSNRSQRLDEARSLIESSPVVGVGPGNYVEALQDQDLTEYLPAHNLVAHQAAELGIVGSIVVVALMVLLGLRVLRGGAWTAAVVAPVLPFLVLDAYPYVFATGLAVSALWLGLARVSLEPSANEGPTLAHPVDRTDQAQVLTTPSVAGAEVPA